MGSEPGIDGRSEIYGLADHESGHMTLSEHVSELRCRILRCLGSLILASMCGWFLYGPVLHFMTEPYRVFYEHHRGELITSNLVISTPTEGFTNAP